MGALQVLHQAARSTAQKSMMLMLLVTGGVAWLLLWLFSGRTTKDKRSNKESGSSDRQSSQHEPQDDRLEGTNGSGHDDSSRLSTEQARIPELSNRKVGNLPHVSSDQTQPSRWPGQGGRAERKLEFDQTIASG